MAASYSHLKSDDGQMSQQTQPMESQEPLGECSVTVEENRFRSSSVYRVPDILKSDRVKREAYVPTRVSLGPYHHETEKLRSMNSHKKKALQRMTTRFNNLANDSLCATEEIVKIRDTRDIYEEIMRTLSDNTSPEDGNCYEPLFEKKKILYTGMDILYDMLKLENQIPFIVLLKLLKLQCSFTDSDAENKLFQMMCESFLSFFYPFKEPQPHHQHEVHHLLGWLRIFIISPHSDNGDGMLHGDIAHSHNGEHARNGHSHNEEHARNGYMRIPGQDDAKEDSEVNCLNWLLSRNCNRDKDSGTYDHIHPAIELGNAGIKFERCEGGIANIKFDERRNTIYLPRITVDDSTEILFRNLIAFEMCKPSEFNYVACYVGLMDQLIDSEEDVALLRKRKIITNDLGSDAEVAQLFNGLCKGVTTSLEGAFDQLNKKVHDHYYNKFRVQVADLVREYFSSPWKTLGLLGGIALLLLSIVQTIFAILALYK